MPAYDLRNETKQGNEEKESLNKLKSSFSPSLEKPFVIPSSTNNYPYNPLQNRLYPYSQTDSFTSGNYIPINGMFPQQFSMQNSMNYGENCVAPFLQQQYG